MLPLTARLVGVFTLFALTIGLSRAQDKEPEVDGKTLSQWAGIAQNDPSARQRVLAVDALGKIWAMNKTTNYGKEVIKHINRRMLNDGSAVVRARAATVLGKLKRDDLDKEVADALVEALKTEKESRVRKEIIATMTKFPGVCILGIEPLTASLKDTDSDVKVAAAEALAQCGALAKSAAPGLVPLLKDKEKPVRGAAIFAL